MNILDDILSLLSDLLTLSPKAMLLYAVGLLILILVVALCAQ